MTSATASCGCVVANQVNHTANRSSPKLRAQLLSGSGERFAAARALAFVPWDVSATPPASNAAAQRQGSEAAAVTLKASKAAAGGRMKVCMACQTESMKGTLSARNSTAYSASATP